MADLMNLHCQRLLNECSFHIRAVLNDRIEKHLLDNVDYWHYFAASGVVNVEQGLQSCNVKLFRASFRENLPCLPLIAAGNCL